MKFFHFIPGLKRPERHIIADFIFRERLQVYGSAFSCMDCKHIPEINDVELKNSDTVTEIQSHPVLGSPRNTCKIHKCPVFGVIGNKRLIIQDFYSAMLMGRHIIMFGIILNQLITDRVISTASHSNDLSVYDMVLLINTERFRSLVRHERNFVGTVNNTDIETVTNGGLRIIQFIIFTYLIAICDQLPEPFGLYKLELNVLIKAKQVPVQLNLFLTGILIHQYFFPESTFYLVYR